MTGLNRGPPPRTRPDKNDVEEEITMMGWHDHGLSAWGWVAMTFGTVAFWGLMVAGIVLLARTLGQAGPPPSDVSAPRTPEQRFARGEIDQAEYHGRLAALHAVVRS